VYMASGDIVDFPVADSLLKEWSEHLVEDSNHWLALMGDSIVLAYWSLELVRCQQATCEWALYMSGNVYSREYTHV
jgi:hypothetical protein